MYVTPDSVEQRKQILQLIDPQPGEHVLDVGSGPGFLTSAIGEAVGPTGWVCGVDISDPLLAVAKTNCVHQPWVEFCKMDAVALPLRDDQFDAVVSTQVLEYLKDVNGALIAFHRVLRADGRVVIVDTDWDSIVWHTNDRQRMHRILGVWEEHTTDPHLPATLPKMMSRAGFHVEAQEIIPLFNPVFDANTFSNRLIDLIVSFVSGRGGVSIHEAAAWAEELRQLGEQNDYFFSLNRYLFIARKI
jgi:SAM-dependent methyltransferase